MFVGEVFMKKLLCLIFLTALFILTGCALEPEEEKEIDVLQAAKERGYFIVGVSQDSKPFGYIDAKTGKPVGFEVDIAKRLALAQFGDENKIQFVKSSGFESIAMVSEGKVDFVISVMTITPQRMMTVDFSEPYYTTGQTIVVKNNSPIKTVKDLNDRRVMVRLTSTAEKTPKKYAPASILIGYRTRQECYDAFVKGEADAMVSDDALLKGFLMDYKGYKILPQKLSVEYYGIAFKSTPEASSLKRFINSELVQMRSDKTFEKLKKKWNV